jgi:predicted nucleic acid-binding protein
MLVMAKRAGLVTSVAQVIDQMRDRINFRISDSLRLRVLADAGE